MHNFLPLFRHFFIIEKLNYFLVSDPLQLKEDLNPYQLKEVFSSILPHVISQSRTTNCSHF